MLSEGKRGEEDAEEEESVVGPPNVGNMVSAVEQRAERPDVM
jgi:hypothetical protein